MTLTEVGLRALRSYEDELISSIQRADSLLPLTKKANEAGLVPQKVNDNLKSMDPDVDHPLKCRYLMLYVYETLARKAKFEKWLELLSRHGIDSSVLVGVRRDCVTLHDDARMKVTSTSPDEISDDFTFSECHISILTEVLADCAHKWREIACYLNCGEREIESIRQKCIIIGE